RDSSYGFTPENAPAFEWVYRKSDSDEETFEEVANQTGSDIYDIETNETALVFAEPVFRRCVSLDLPCMGLWPSQYVCECEHLVNLRRLNFPNNEAGPNIEAVASPTFANLRWANFNYSNSANGRPSVVPFAECPHLVNLEYLDFGCNALRDDNLKALARTPHLPRLRYLNLGPADFGYFEVMHFFGADSLPALAELDLSQSFGFFGESDGADTLAAAIAGLPRFARLSKLLLRRNSITDRGAKALASAPAGVKLTLLDLRGNPIGPEGQRALIERFGAGMCVFGEDEP
ncbi:MAG: hypothetical protein K2V38_09715, partial [Gemmataceae bacterium]|nr:hypothetical protein [Gemmataceae bacterium]